MSRYVQVAVPVPLRRLFSYRLPEGVDVIPALRVEVPFGRRTLVGMITHPPTDEPAGDYPAEKLKTITRVLDETPVLGPDVMALSRWMAHYYHVAPG